MNNADFVARDLAVLWHPCTQMQDHEWLPLVPIRRGSGVWLEDYDGQRYLDAVSSWWVNLFGHANPRISSALARQAGELEHVIFGGFSHAPALRLAERLVNLTPPSLVRCFLADNGSSAVEVAIKMSFHYWRNVGIRGKRRVVNLTGAYHGETLGALGVGDVGLYRDPYVELLQAPLTAPSPDAYERSPGESWADVARRRLDDMQALLERHADEVCAVIVEPLVQCAGGMRMYHADYLKGLRALCDRYQVHLIADEIAVGFGRTGTLFACEQAGIAPDFLCLSKGLTGGYLPLAAVLTTDTVYQAFYADYASQRAFLHSHSYSGNPLGCAAALATLDIFAEEPVLQRNQALAAAMARETAHLQDHPHVAEVRQTGMILAIELVQDKASRRPYPWQERRGLRVYQHALQNGVLLRPLGNVVYFMPPYVISEDEIRLMAQVACAGIAQAVA